MSDPQVHPPPPLLGTLESALYASDLDAAADFWSRVMGLEEIVRVPGRHVFFRTGGQVLLIFDPASTARPPPADAPVRVPPHGATGPGHFCLAVDDDQIDRWRRHLERHGIEIESEVVWKGGARSIYFRDPAGNSIELADPRLWA